MAIHEINLFCKHFTNEGKTNLLSDASHNGKVLREVSGQNPSDAVGVQVFQLLQLCKTNIKMLSL